MRRRAISRSNAFPRHLAAAAWACALLAALFFLAFKFTSGPVLDADILNLLPQEERDPVVERAAEEMRQTVERRLVLLAGAESESAALALARSLDEELRRAPGLAPLPGLRRSGTALSEFYFARPYGLVDSATHTLLMEGDIAALEAEILRRYQSPSSLINSSLIVRDPLLLLPGFLDEALPAPPPGLRFAGGMPVYASEGRFFVPLFYEVEGSPFALDVQAKAAAALEMARAVAARAEGGASLWSAGVVRHAARGSEEARSEISTVGLGSLLGVVLLVLFVFRSALPLAASVLSVGSGIIAGLAATLAVFGEVHLLTLVFGGSLIGISVDYLFHYFCERTRPDKNVTAEAALSHVFPGITLGLVTTLIGFAGLWLAPFPGLRQMALFSSAGLAASYLTVSLLFPLIAHRANPMASAPLAAASWLLAHWQAVPRLVAVILFAVLAVVSVLGISHLAPQDDVRLFQSLDDKLLAEQARIESVLARAPESRFFLVEGESRDELLMREEALREELQGAARLTGLSRFVPSRDRQEADRKNLMAFLSDEAVMASLTDKVGLERETLETYRRGLDEAPFLTLQEWFESPASTPYRHLYLGETERGFIAALTLEDIKQEAALEKAAARAGVHFIDTAATYSRLFAEYRHKAALLALLSYVFVAALLLWRYGPKGAAAVMAVPLAAALTSLGFIGLSGDVFSLFNVMALLLVLGISVDYGIFFREAGSASATTFLAVTLSALTTLLAFGLLAFSGTAAIHAFGITVFAGITMALAVSPLAGAGRQGGK